jgi:diguanylate cyclase (GGDEF)-like protein
VGAQLTDTGQPIDPGPPTPSGSEWALAWLYPPAAVAMLVLLPGGQPLLLWPAVAAMAAYLVQRVVRLPLADGYVSIVQPAFILLLFTVPLNVVALLVPAGVFASTIVGYRSVSVRRIPLALADAWYCIPPILVRGLFAPGPIAWQHWPIYTVAVVAELGVSFVGPFIRLAIYRANHAVEPATLLLPAAIDLLLTPFGFAAAAAATMAPAGSVLMLASVLTLMALLGHERTERIEYEQLALRDPLTGLANRALFDELLDAAGRRLARAGHQSALLFIDLDDFKGVNDTHGHLAGDVVLRTVAERVKSAVREADTVARFGGDEIAVLLADPTGVDAIERVAGAIRSAISEPIRLDDADAITITASIGVASLGSHMEPTDVVTQADEAMYQAKHLAHARDR